MEFVEQVFSVLAAIAAVGFLISGLDDLFFDSQFVLHLWRTRKRPPLTLQQLKLEPEKWVALLVPAWLEGGVVNKMAEYANRVVLYEKYDIFIGVYPNDPATNRCVDEICASHPRIHKVVVPHPGPTSKADCLNWIYRAMRLHETPGVREYSVVAIHDAEDVMHPLVLKVYNYFVPRTYDMAQLPVFALEHSPWRHFVANTYVDDFAELHTKDIFVRESIGGVVPSAGVGTAFSRRALEKLAAASKGDPFRVGNLTEDYEVGIRIKRAGFRSGMVSVPIERIAHPKKRDGTPGPPKAITELVAVREIFPQTFRTAVRQRSRWILGICFQTWEQAGWAGSLAMRYTLARDRRAPLTHLINMIGYLVLAFMLCQGLLRLTPWGASVYLRPILTPDSWVWKVAIIDTWLLAYRAVQKFISVAAVYNWRQAVMSIPRVLVGNVINFTATVSAFGTFLAHKFFGKPIVWLKTVHTFPGEDDLAEYSKSIEDLLVEEGFVTREQVFAAVGQANGGSVPSALLRMGLLSEEDYTAIWAKHSGLEARFINPYQIPPDVLGRWAETQAVESGALPVAKDGGRITIAFREPPSRRQVEQLGAQLGATVFPVLTRPANLAFARNRAYPRRVLAGSTLASLPEKFRQSSSLDAVVFLDALSSQQAGRSSLPDVMVDMAMLSEGEARRLWAGVIGCPASTFATLQLQRETYYRVGPFFWWLHRMLPVQQNKIAVAATLHPAAVEWLAGRLGSERTPAFVAELPRKLEVAARQSGFNFDPEKLQLDSLADKGILKPEDLARVKTMRGLVTDPMPRWLLLQKLVTEEQLNATFREVCHLPRVTAWKEAEVKRLAALLPPGFATEHACYCLEESGGNIRLGLARLPSAEVVRQIHDRLAGAAICFQSLPQAEAERVRTVMGS